VVLGQSVFLAPASPYLFVRYEEFHAVLVTRPLLDENAKGGRRFSQKISQESLKGGLVPGGKSPASLCMYEVALGWHERPMLVENVSSWKRHQAPSEVKIQGPGARSRYMQLRKTAAAGSDEARVLMDRFGDYWATRLWEVYEDDGKTEPAVRSEAGESWTGEGLANARPSSYKTVWRSSMFGSNHAVRA